MKLKKQIIMTLAFFILFVCGVFSLCLRAEAKEPIDYSDLTFYGPNGEEICVSDFKEDAVVLMFGRESCGNCMATIRDAARLAAAGTNAKFVFLKIDNLYSNNDYSWDDFCEDYGEYVLMTNYGMYYNNTIASNISYETDINFAYTPFVVILGKNREFIDGYSGYNSDKFLEAISSVTENKYVSPYQVRIKKDKTTIAAGDTVQFETVITPTKATICGGTWSVLSYPNGDEDVSNIATIDKNGELKALSPGHIWVRYSYDFGSYMQTGIKIVGKSTTYKVKHSLENVDGSFTTTTETFSGNAGEEYIASTKYYNGFSRPSSQMLTVKEDGSSEVEFKYYRNKHKLTWNFDGGKTVGDYTRGEVKYDTPISVPEVNKSGYILAGWDVVITYTDYNYQDQRTYIPQNMPDADLTITAIWKEESNNNHGQNNGNNNQNDSEEQVKAFVTRFYTLILNREPEEDGINYWTQILLNKEQTGAEVAYGFVNSPEFTVDHPVNDEEFVKRMYAAFFDRDGGTEGEAWWLGYLNKGYTRNYVLAGFTNSDEFGRLCSEYGIVQGSLPMDESMKTNPQPQPQPHVDRLNIDASNVDSAKLDEYIDRLYLLVLKRNPEAGGKQYWREEIIKGDPYNASTAAEIGFFNSPEYLALNKTDEEFIRDCYLVFLNREPEDGGFEYWKEKFKTGEYDRQKLIEVGVGHSNEFKDILRSYGFVIIE